MDCATARLAVSALLDGEGGDLPGEMAPELVEAHLDDCADCRAWRARALDLTRTSRVRTAPAVPDLTGRIVAAVDLAPAAEAAEDRRRWAERMPVLRVALVALGLVHLLASLHSMVAGSAEPGSLHATHEVGAFDVALAVAVVIAGWRPALASGLLPLAAGASVFLIFTSGLDIAHHHTTFSGELGHCVVLIEAALLALVRYAAYRSGTPFEGTGVAWNTGWDTGRDAGGRPGRSGGVAQRGPRPAGAADQRRAA
jgi:predicted anti-sigma-YlaC factor YlaD